MLWLPILIGIAICGVTTYVIYRSYINKKILEEEVRKLKRELFKERLKSRITEIIKEGEYNTVKISSYDEYDNKVAELEVRGETIEDDVYKGMILTT